MNINEITSKTHEFLGTSACPKCGAWNATSHWRSAEGEEIERHEGCRCEADKINQQQWRKA